MQEHRVEAKPLAVIVPALLVLAGVGALLLFAAMPLLGSSPMEYDTDDDGIISFNEAMAAAADLENDLIDGDAFRRVWEIYLRGTTEADTRNAPQTEGQPCETYDVDGSRTLEVSEVATARADYGSGDLSKPDMITVLNCYYLNIADSNVARFPCWGPEGCWQLTATAVSQPTSTPIPPTSTSIPPTSTSIPPTKTPIPPTSTSIPPTKTPIPPTSTSILPTACPRDADEDDTPRGSIGGCLPPSPTPTDTPTPTPTSPTPTPTAVGAPPSGPTATRVPAPSAVIIAGTTTLQVGQTVTVTAQMRNITGDPMWLMPTAGAIASAANCLARSPQQGRFNLNMTTRIQGCHVGSGTLQVGTTSDGWLASKVFTVVAAPTSLVRPAPAPSGFTVTLTSVGVQARWEYLDDADGYQVEYRAVGDTVWQSVTVRRDWLLVLNLTAGVTYEFQLSARGDGSPYLTTYGNRTSIKTVEIPPEKLDTPQLTAIQVGYGRVSLSWTGDARPAFYTVEIRRDCGVLCLWHTPGGPSSNEILELDNASSTAMVRKIQNDAPERFEFRVKAYAPPGTPPPYKDSDWSNVAGVSMKVLFAIGHQLDHVVGYEIGPDDEQHGTRPTSVAGMTIKDPWLVLTYAAARSARLWNNSGVPSGSALEICHKDRCGAANSDNESVKVKLAGNYADSNNRRCPGASSACFEDNRRAGHQITGGPIIIEEPGYEGLNMIGSPIIRVYWTDDISLDQHAIMGLGMLAKWSYMDYEVAHELGHAFGLHDFVSHPNYDGIMDQPRWARPPSISDDDRAHLIELYRGQVPGEEW